MPPRNSRTPSSFQRRVRKSTSRPIQGTQCIDQVRPGYAPAAEGAGAVAAEVHSGQKSQSFTVPHLAKLSKTYGNRGLLACKKRTKSLFVRLSVPVPMPRSLSARDSKNEHQTWRRKGKRKTGAGGSKRTGRTGGGEHRTRGWIEGTGAHKPVRERVCKSVNGLISVCERCLENRPELQ